MTRSVIITNYGKYNKLFESLEDKSIFDNKVITGYIGNVGKAGNTEDIGDVGKAGNAMDKEKTERVGHAGRTGTVN